MQGESRLCACGCGTVLPFPLVYKGRERFFVRFHHLRVIPPKPSRPKPPRIVKPKPTLSERFWKFVARGPDCWMWTGTTHKDDGRGYFQIDGRPHIASRVAWELSYGPIPDGLHVCHTCDRPGCCRPDHLWLGTGPENHADKARKGRAPRGERTHAAKLTETQVLAIRTWFATGGISQGELAVRYRVSQPVISAIIRRKTWRHI